MKTIKILSVACVLVVFWSFTYLLRLFFISGNYNTELIISKNHHLYNLVKFFYLSESVFILNTK